MLKKISHKLVLAVLLILTVVTLAVATSVLAFANNTPAPIAQEAHSLTVNFDPTLCSVKYYFDGVAQGVLENGISVLIPDGELNVKVEVDPKLGYKLQKIEGYPTQGENYIVINSFNQDFNLAVTCEKKTFNVKLLPEEGEVEKTYTFAPEVADKYNQLTYTLGDLIIIDPAEKTSGGYTFKYWELIYDYTEENGLITVKPENKKQLTKNDMGEWILPEDLAISTKWQEKGEIYLRPYLEPNLYPVWWYDYVIISPEDPTGEYLLTSAYSTNEPMASKISNQPLPDALSPYVGYDFFRTDAGNFYKTITVNIDTPDDDHDKLNKVYRYFVPIEYALEYDYNFGELADSNATVPLKHVFDETTAIPVAQRLGFAFGGWEVLVNGTVVETLTDLNNLQLSEKNPLYANGNTDKKITLRAIWLLNIEDYKIDYQTETFAFPAGKYVVALGEIRKEFTVGTDGICTEKIPEEFFGYTVDLTFLGQNTGDVDYHGKLPIQARPAAPVDAMFGDFSVSADTAILINMAEGVDSSVFEFSLAIKGEPEKMRDWQSSPKFEGLYQGTVYTIYIRVKATDTAPCGIVAEFETKTGIGLYIKDLIDELKALTNEDDGEVVADLLLDATERLNELESLGSSTTFYADADEIVNNFKSELRLARQKDQKIAALRNYKDALLQTGAYNAENASKLDAICNDAVAVIKNASEDDNLQQICDDSTKLMAEVKISHLKDTDGTMQITGLLGMHKDSKLILVRFPDFTSQADRVYEAIDAGKVFGTNGTTTQELIQLLKSQDVIAAYRMQLDEVGATDLDPSKGFECRLLLPQELREVNGMRVVYYDNATGRLEVLESRVEGEYLVFTADRITDFLILGDPSLNLTVPIIALSVILLCQVIGIAVLLVCRYKSNNAIRHYGLALPVMLTVQTFPKNGSVLVLVLGILVVLLQIVLMALLLNSEIVHRSRLQRSKTISDDSSIPTMASADPALYEDEGAPAEEDEQQPNDEQDQYAAYYVQQNNTEDQETWQEDPAFYEESPYEDTLEADPNEEEFLEDMYAENEDAVYYEFAEPAEAENEQLADSDYNAEAQSVDNVFYGEGNGTYAEELYDQVEPLLVDSDDDAVFIEAPLYSYDDSIDAVYGEQDAEDPESEGFYFDDSEIEEIVEQEITEEEDLDNKTQETL